MSTVTTPRPRWSISVAITGVALFVVTILLRGFQLGQPRTFVYDEIFYANDAVDLVTRGIEQTRVGHPPMAKWLIGLGFAFTRFSPATWRIAPLVAGAIVVVLVFACAWRLTNSLGVGLAAAGLVLTDGIAHEMGRYAFLDGFVALFTTATLAVFLFSWHRRTSFRIAALVGALAGAALASKWSAAPLLLLVLVVVFERGRRSESLHRSLALAAAVLGAAIVVYTATYSPWIITGRSSGNCTTAACRSNAFRRLTLLPAMQRDMLKNDALVSRANQEAHPGIEWATQQHLMRLFDEPCRGIDDGVCRANQQSRVTVEVRGNLVLWVAVWPALGLYAFTRRRRGVAADEAGPLWLVALWLATLWVPWVALSHTFVFYAAPMIPPLAVFVAVALYRGIGRRLAPLILGSIVVAAAVTFFATQPSAPWRS